MARLREPPAAIMLAIVFFWAQLHSAFGAIDNSAIAVGSYNAAPVSSNTSLQSVPVIPAAPAVSVVKSGVLNDDDGTPGLSAGDTVSYTVSVENTGNVSLTNPVVADPLVVLTYTSGDLDSDGEIDANETWIYAGSYTITQPDIDTNGGGDGDIDNTVTVSTDQLADEQASHSVPINGTAAISVSKTGVLNDDDGTPGLSAGDTVGYVIDIQNTGTVTQSNISVTDNLVQGASSVPLAATYQSGDLDTNNLLDVGETWRYSAIHTLTQQNIDDGGNLVNTATVNTDQSGPVSGDDTIVLSGFVDSYTMTKTATLVDGDGDALGDPGEVINFTFRFTNTGNRTLANLRATDPLPGLSAILCAADVDSDGDIDLLPPGNIQDCTASYVIQPADITAGVVTNIATSSATRLGGLVPVAEDDTANDNSTTTPMDRVVDIDVDKTVVSAIEILPNIVEIEYQILIANTGTVLQTNLTVEEDLGTAIAGPAQMLGVPVVSSFSGFSGSGTLNPSYDGTGDTAVLTGDVQLAPLATGTIRIVYQVDRVAGSLSTNNTALVSSSEISGQVPSDDPTVTPGNPNDVNPTVFNLPDNDNDGSDDFNESGISDRDFDGVPDSSDYDPTGYFYCEADGRILTGGSITIENLTSGGTQSGVGSSNNITILQDGSAGYYQFYVTAPGTYRLIPTLPATGAASTSRLSLGNLDVTTLLPFNPGVLGSGEIGSTGVLADFTAAANPFFTEFTIENGDPTIFNNNIPLELCGTPQLALSKTISSGPTLQADDTNNLSFEVTLENTGSVRVDNVALIDNLDAVFGAGNFTILGTSLVSAPPGFSATTDPFFDGSGNTQLLTAGGNLEIGELVTVAVDLNVDVAAGLYTNTAICTADSALTGLPLGNESVSVDFNINRLANGDGLIVSKTTPFDAVPLGARVPFTIVLENQSATDANNVEFVDFMPAGFTYLPGSARLNGVPVEPATSGRELVWPGQNLASGASATIELSLAVGAAAKGPRFVNSAFIREPVSNSVLSNVAKAVVRLEIEPVFQCSDVIGRVFDDLDRDGYYDEGEPGLAGVRVVTVGGLLITTDSFGRYHVTCDMVPDGQIGSNYILKLDERTLPTGYRVTSENPRVVRLTRGKTAWVNFAAANLRTIRLELSDDSFKPNTSSLTDESIKNVAAVISVLEKERSVLQIDYQTTGSIRTSHEERLDAVSNLIRKAWDSRRRPYPLKIEPGVKR